MEIFRLGKPDLGRICIVDGYGLSGKRGQGTELSYSDDSGCLYDGCVRDLYLYCQDRFQLAFLLELADWPGCLCPEHTCFLSVEKQKEEIALRFSDLRLGRYSSSLASPPSPVSL